MERGRRSRTAREENKRRETKDSGLILLYKYCLPYVYLYILFPYIFTLVNVLWIVTTEPEQFCTSSELSQISNVTRDYVLMLFMEI